MKKIGQPLKEADLDITSFLNLMIVLVPVLLLNMTFSTLHALHLALPELSDRIVETPLENQQLEMAVTPNQIELFFPAGVSLVKFDVKNQTVDQKTVRAYLKQVKATFAAQNQDKTDMSLLLHPQVSYQLLVSVIETVRSMPDVVAASVVEAALFPDISLGDLPGGEV